MTYSSIHSNTKTNSTLLKLANKNLLRRCTLKRVVYKIEPIQARTTRLIKIIRYLPSDLARIFFLGKSEKLIYSVYLNLIKLYFIN